MGEKFVDYIYLTLAGELEEYACVPGVESIFEEGMLCDNLYGEILNAYERIRDRLGNADAEEDADVEIIINAFLEICKEMGVHMYHYGAMFGEVD